MDDSLLKELEIRQSFLNDTINKMTSFLRNVPKGQLKCMNKKKGPQYYWITEKGETNGKYIPKQNLDFAAVLAQKCYDQEILKQAKKALKLLQDELNNEVAQGSKDYQNRERTLFDNV